MSYNGWTNYETWNVALWLDNEEGSHRYWRGEMNEIWENAEEEPSFTRSEVARRQLGDRLKDEITESQPDLGASMWADLLGAAMSEVDWDEIANNWLDEIDEYESREATA